jgi:hypothetical protein
MSNITPMEVAGWNRESRQSLSYGEYCSALESIRWGGGMTSRMWGFHLGWGACVEMVVGEMEGAR